MIAMLLISAAFLISLFGMSTGRCNVTGGSFVAAGAILLVASIPWFIQAARYPGLLSAVVFATLGVGAAFLNILAGLLTLRTRNVDLEDS
jgi:hypothetical protein